MSLLGSCLQLVCFGSFLEEVALVVEREDKVFKTIHSNANFLKC